MFVTYLSIILFHLIVCNLGGYGVKAEDMLPGGTSGARPVDADAAQEIIKVKPEVESKLGKQLSKWEPISMKTQVVAGLNYFVKVDIGDEIVHLRIYRDLGGNVALHGMQRNKDRDEELAYFTSE